MTTLLSILSLIALAVGGWATGRRNARLKARNDALEADKEANERMNHASISSGDADADREWLRKRSGK